MLPIQFPDNSSNMRYEYHRVREGPNFFITYYKNSSRLIYDPKDAWRTLGVAKFTDTGKTLKEWCLQMDEEYGAPQRIKWIANETAEPGTPDTSFASESELEAEGCASANDLEEPHENTKMVT
jgi:hypothetical protein